MADGSSCSILTGKIQFTLVANGKNARLILCGHKTVERDVAGLTIRNHQLA